MAQTRLVLASSSPYRRALLDRLGLTFETFTPDIDETALPGETAQQQVRRLARAKATTGSEAFGDALIIGSDQVAVCGQDVLGKPGSHERARRQLARLAGQRVSFLTGLCLYHTSTLRARVDMVPYHVRFRALSETQIERYLSREQPYNCAGSFKSEGLGISLFESMEGEDPSALIGLPLIRLVTWLNEAGVSVP